MAAPRRAAVLALVPLLAVALAGCLDIEPARVPDALLTTASGWKKDASASDEEASSSAMGTTRVQTLAYRDLANDGKGYPGTLSVITLRTLLTPSQDALLDEVQGQVRTLAEAKGIRIDGEAQKGTRSLANEASSRWFTYNGTATSDGDVFTTNAKMKVLGEVFQCRAERTAVVVVALAQVTSVRSLGSVPFPSESDPATWREIAADPSGAIEGLKGPSGLAYNVVCF